MPFQQHHPSIPVIYKPAGLLDELVLQDRRSVRSQSNFLLLQRLHSLILCPDNKVHSILLEHPHNTDCCVLMNPPDPLRVLTNDLPLQGLQHTAHRSHRAVCITYCGISGVSIEPNDPCF